MPQTVAIASVAHDSRHKKASVKTKKTLESVTFCVFLPQWDAIHARRVREKVEKKTGKNRGKNSLLSDSLVLSNSRRAGDNVKPPICCLYKG